MTHATIGPWLLLLVLASEVGVAAQLIRLFLKHATNQLILMTDILFLLISIAFFALMIVFVWACEKV